MLTLTHTHLEIN